MLGLAFLLPAAVAFEPALASEVALDAKAGFGSESCVCSGVATPKKVATASQELRSREVSGFDFAGSVGGETAGSKAANGSAFVAAFGGLVECSDFLVVGFREGVLSRFAILFQWSDMSKSFRVAAGHTR